MTMPDTSLATQTQAPPAVIEGAEDGGQTIRYEALQGEVALNVNFVRQYFNPKVSAQEAFAFMRFCQYHHLNPFLRDAYLIKYKADESAQFVVGYHVWTQRAQEDRNYKGYKAGTILLMDDEVHYREGAFYLPNKETLVGGWCEINVEGRDRVRTEVALHEYDRHQALWKTHPATMIQKVAIGQAHRAAYPRLFAGAYDQAEVGPSESLPTDPVVIDAAVSAALGPATNDGGDPWDEPQAPASEVNGAGNGSALRRSRGRGGRLGRCPVHNQSWATMPNGEVGHPHGDGACYQSQVDQAAGEVEPPAGEQPAGATEPVESPAPQDEEPVDEDKERILDLLAMNNMDWKRLEDDVLHMPWEEYERLNGTYARALADLIAWLS